MPKTQIRYISAGECPKCGITLIRPVECSHAVCTCSNPITIVPLEPALILPARMRGKLEKIAKSSTASLEEVVNEVLELGLEKIKTLEIKEILERAVS